MPTLAPASSPTALSPCPADQLHALCDPIVRCDRSCLETDRAEIEASASAPFVCIARPAGTWLAVLYPPEHPSFPAPLPAGSPLYGVVTREGLVAGTLGFLRFSARNDTSSDPWFFYPGLGDVRQVQPFFAVAIVDDWAARVRAAGRIR